MPRMFLFVVLSLLAACGAPDSTSEKAVSTDALTGPNTSDPIPGNPGCPEGLRSYKVDAPQGRRYPLGDGTLSVSLAFERTAEGEVLSWSANLGVDAVIVKGGDAALLYRYGPEYREDTGLHSPRNASGGYADVSHVTFCYDLEVQLHQEGRTSFQRTHHWTVQKTGSSASLELPAGATATVGYDVTVGPAAVPFTDAGWRLDGELTVSNPAPVAATLTGVSVVLTGDIEASVVCPARGWPVPIRPDAPYTLAPGGTLVCRYSASLPEGSPRGATATVTTQGPVLGGTNDTSVDFSGATMEAVDECIDVEDSLTGALPSVCVGHGLPRTFSYTWELGPYAASACGRHTVDNVATFRTNDTGATGSASWPVALQVPCQQPDGDPPGIILDGAGYQVWQQDCAGLLDLTDGVLRIRNTGGATATVQSVLFSARFKVGTEEFNVAGGALFDCGVRTLPVITPGQHAWVTFGCGNLFPLSATEVRLTAHVRVAGQQQPYQLTHNIQVR